MADERFGRLLVLERIPSGRHSRCRCRCDCGTEVMVWATNLRAGRTRSCGCLRGEVAGRQSVTHGQRCGGRKHPLYETWKEMRRRCRDRRNKRWRDYGGRGITVCERWLGRDGFANFAADMGPRPDGRVLDRIDNDGNYEPGNCRWATYSESNLNRRPFRKAVR